MFKIIWAFEENLLIYTSIKENYFQFWYNLNFIPITNNFNMNAAFAAGAADRNHYLYFIILW